VVESLFGGSKATLRVDDVTIESWGEVVVNFLGWVSVFIFVDSNPVVLHNTLSNMKVFKRSLDVSVHTEVWNGVVHIVFSFLRIWVFVLGATS